MDRRPPADAGLDRGRLLQRIGPRPPGVAAGSQGPRAGADSSRPRRPHPELDPGERPPGGLRRPQTDEGSRVHAAVDTVGHLLAVRVTPADAQERAQVAALAKAVQDAARPAMELAYVNQGYTRADPALDAADHGIRLEVVKLNQAKRGFVLLPRR